MDSGRPFTTAYHVGDMRKAFDTMRAGAQTRQHIPGHDPLVMTRYPAARPDVEDVAVRLDVMPQQ